MARKQNPYNTLTISRINQLGWYYQREERINPFHIIKEREDLRIFRRSVADFCEIALRTDDFDLLKKWIIVLQERTSILTNNKYFAGEKTDWFGFGDYACLAPDAFVVVQSTSRSGHSTHRKKILRNVYAQRFVNYRDARIELWSWKNKLGNVTPSAKGWDVKVEVITLEMFMEFANNEKNTNYITDYRPDDSAAVCDVSA